jgi:SAM-dependent methyltransferase
MEGHGYYSEHSRPQQNAGAFGIPLIAPAIEAMHPPASGVPFLVADYGCAQGRSSLAPARAAIDAVRKRWGPDVPVTVVHTDLPGNDFNSLFTLVETAPDSYLRGEDNAFAYAAGVGFYEPIFPPGTVSLGWNAIAVHWLSRVPCPLEGQILSTRAMGATRAAWARQSQEDWQRFLDFRARELRPDGRLVVVASGAGEDGLTGAEGLLDMANAALQEMLAGGVLRAAEYERIALPTFYRRMEEFTAPFHPRCTSPRGEVLELESRARAVVRDPFAPQLQQGDVSGFAAEETGFLRAFSEPLFLAALEADRSPVERQQVTDDFYRRVQGRVAANPQAAVCNWQLLLFVIARTT